MDVHSYLDFSVDKFSFELSYKHKFLFVGSCFSDEINERCQFAGFNSHKDGFGTIFHPSVLARNILAAFDDDFQISILQRDDLFFSWDASSTIWARSENELKSTILEKRKLLKDQLQSIKVLFVTFGTAWGYELVENDYLVANCHKLASANFNKVLSSPYELVQDWNIALELLKQHNPNLQIVFTVSPVRHIKDGLVENNLSKARLIEACQQLSFESNCHYFPSYEIVIDVLRDYQFFKKDMVHPNEKAVDFIWAIFKQTFLNDEDNNYAERIEKYHQGLEHRIAFPGSNEAIKFEAFLAKEKQELLDINSYFQLK